MKILTKTILAAAVLLSAPLSMAGEWVEMFDGKTLKGWKNNPENPETFSVEDGAIKVEGKRSHLFYGEDGDAMFKNFEFECEVKTAENANSGVFIHTKFQKKGWPSQGYECQVNATHKDERKTGSIYSIQDLKETDHKDGEWFTYHIKVEGKKVTVSINGKVVNEYTEPAEHAEETKRFSEGTIALQGHDPDSLIYFRKLRIKALD